MSGAVETEDVRDRDLRVGDVIHDWIGWRRIVAIRPYTGPLDCVIGTADTVPPGSFSLTEPGWTTRAKVAS